MIERLEIFTHHEILIYNVLEDGEWFTRGVEDFYDLIPKITSDTIIYDERSDSGRKSERNIYFFLNRYADVNINFIDIENDVRLSIREKLSDEISSNLIEDRISHSIDVSKLCVEIFNAYGKYVVNKKSYDMYSLTPKESSLYSMYLSDMSWAFKLVGLVHDIGKYTPNKMHSEIGAEYLKKLFGEDISDKFIPVKNMIEAIKYHQQKDLHLSNVFYDILVDADIISKHSVKSFRLLHDDKYKNMTLEESLEDTKQRCAFYKYKTPVSERILFKRYNEVLSEIRREKIFNGTNNVSKEE